MKRRENIALDFNDVLIWNAAQNSYVEFVTDQVMKGVVEHPEVPPDWIGPRIGHIQSSTGLSTGDAYEAMRLAEELVHAKA